MLLMLFINVYSLFFKGMFFVNFRKFYKKCEKYVLQWFYLFVKNTRIVQVVKNTFLKIYKTRNWNFFDVTLAPTCSKKFKDMHICKYIIYVQCTCVHEFKWFLDSFDRIVHVMYYIYTYMCTRV